MATPRSNIALQKRIANYKSNLRDALESTSSHDEDLMTTFNNIMNDEQLNSLNKVELLINIPEIGDLWESLTDDSVDKLLEWLKAEVSNQHIGMKNVLHLIATKNSDGMNLAQICAFVSNNTVTAKALNLLNNALKEKNLAEEVLAILNNQSTYRNNWTLGHFLAKYRDKSVNKCYLNLLQNLLKHISIDQMYELLEKKSSQETGERPYVYLLAHEQEIDVIFELIYENSNILPEWQCEHLAKSISNLKERLIQFISMIADKQKRINVLSDAKDELHPLGKIFWTKRGTRETSPERGTLKTINQQYDALRKEGFSVTLLSLFQPPRTPRSTSRTELTTHQQNRS